MSSRSSLVSFLLLVMTLLFVSCAERIAPQLDVTQSAQTLVVRPAGLQPGTGQTMQLTVKRRYPGGPLEDITASTLYSIEKGIGEVTDHGLVTAGTQAGSLIIRVYDASSDTSALASVIVLPSTIVSIDITPSPAIVLAGGESRLFTAQARYASGDVADVSQTVSWSSTEESVALVGNSTFDKGIVRAIAPGNTTILATDGATNVQGRSTVFVASDGLTLVSITLTPNPVSVSVGATAQLRAGGVYSDGSTKDISAGVSWTSSRPDLVTVDAAGFIAGIKAGDATISASGPAPSTDIRGSAAAKVGP